MNYDKISSQKTFTNLDTMGSAIACGNHCCMDVFAEESNTGIVATTCKGTRFTCKIN
jgi:hypothetical protein